jgi:hypothetical protein
MIPSSEELELGAKAVWQVRYYEKVVVKDIRQMPWFFAMLSSLFIIAYVLQTHAHWPTDLLFYLFVPLCFTIRLWQNRVATIHYANQKLLLKLLKEKYGDHLPWIIEEKQLAEARVMEAASRQAHAA